MKIQTLNENEVDLDGFQELPKELRDKPNDSNANLVRNKKEKGDEKKGKEKQVKKDQVNDKRELIDSAVKHLRNKEEDEAQADINAWLVNIGF